MKNLIILPPVYAVVALLAIIVIPFAALLCWLASDDLESPQ